MASRSLGTLTLDMAIRLGGFTAGMDKAARVTDTRMKEMERRAESFGRAIGTSLRVGVAALAVGATSAVVALKATIDRMDDLSKAAKTVGMDTEGFSRLAYAAELANVSQEELQSGLGRLVKAQAAAMDEGSKQAEMFKALGIAITDAGGAMRPTRDVMLDFADRFAALKDKPEALAAGLQIFGRGFQTFVPLIEGGSDAIRRLEGEADSLGVTLSTEAGRSAEEFNDNLTRLKAAVSGFTMEVAQGMLPVLEDSTARLVDLATQGDLAENVVTVLSAAFRVGVSAVEGYNRAVQVTSAAIETIVNASAGFAEIQRNIGIGAAFDPGSMVAGAEKVRAAFEEGDKALARINDKSKSLFANVQSSASNSASGVNSNLAALRRALTDPGGKDAKKAAADAARAAKEAEREAERLAKAIRKMTDAQRDWQTELDGTGNQVVDDYAKRLDEITESAEKFAEDGVPTAKIAEFKAEMTSLAEQIKAKDLAQFSADFALETQSLANSVGGLSNATVEYTIALGELDKLLKSGAISQSEYADRQKELEKAQTASSQQMIRDMQFELSILGLTNKERERAIALRYAEANGAIPSQIAQIGKLSDELYEGQKAQEQWAELQASMADSFYDFATSAKSAGDALGDFLDAIYSSAIKAASEYFSEQITNMFKGANGSSGSTGQGGWGELFGAFAGFFGGGKAGGGIALPNTMYQVNERGFEMATVGGKDYMLTGNSPVNVTPNHMLGGGGQGTYNFNFAAPASEKTATQVAARMVFEQRRSARFVGAAG